MENKLERWISQKTKGLKTASSPLSIRSAVNLLKQNLDERDHRPIIPLGSGDPSSFPCFQTTSVAEDAITDAIKSKKLNGYAPTGGILPARRAVAEYLSRDLPYQLSPDDVYLTTGCKHAIEVIVMALAHPGANILLPKPGYPVHEVHAAANNLEVRHFDLLPEKGWEINLDAIEALADENTVAMVIINPGNPCGSVYRYKHLNKVAEIARKLGILVIADEIYGHIAFGNNPFLPMGVFGSIVPVITLGSMSKRWMIPGWRVGWLVTTDPTGTLQNSGIVAFIKNYLNTSSSPATFIQGAIPQILKQTPEEFFSETLKLLREASNICYDTLKEIPCITCPYKPDGSMFVMVKLDVSLLEDINEDREFCLKLAKEESVIIVPGVAVGMKNWLRITFAVELSSLEDGLGRLKAFCQRHSRIS